MLQFLVLRHQVLYTIAISLAHVLILCLAKCVVGAPIKKRKSISSSVSDVQPIAPPLVNLALGATWSIVEKERRRISLRLLGSLQQLQ